MNSKNIISLFGILLFIFPYNVNCECKTNNSIKINEIKIKKESSVEVVLDFYPLSKLEKIDSSYKKLPKIEKNYEFEKSTSQKNSSLFEIIFEEIYKIFLTFFYIFFYGYFFVFPIVFIIFTICLWICSQLE
jgi:hypothetical protein